MQGKPSGARSSRAAVCVAGLASLGILAGPLALSLPAVAETPTPTPSATTPGRAATTQPGVNGKLSIKPGGTQAIGAPWPLIVLETAKGGVPAGAFLVDFDVCLNQPGGATSCVTASDHLSAKQRTITGQSDILRRTVDLPPLQYNWIRVDVRLTPLDAGAGKPKPATVRATWTKAWWTTTLNPTTG